MVRARPGRTVTGVTIPGGRPGGQDAGRRRLLPTGVSRGERDAGRGGGGWAGASPPPKRLVIIPSRSADAASPDGVTPLAPHVTSDIASRR